MAQADWDPRRDTGYVFLVLRPVRVQAWREANEIAGRTLMRDGSWLVWVEPGTAVSAPTHESQASCPELVRSSQVTPKGTAKALPAYRWRDA